MSDNNINNNPIVESNIKIIKPEIKLTSSTQTARTNTNEILINSPINNKISNPSHSLEFYAYGKLNNHTNFNSTNSSFEQPKTSLRKIQRSSSDIFYRNLLSVNHSKYEKMIDIKPQSTIFDFNLKENTYLNPFPTYNLRKYKIINSPNFNINSKEMLNLSKNKLFAKDINSTIKIGQNISKNQFIDQKNSIIKQQIDKYTKKNYNLNEGYDFKGNINNQNDCIINCKRYKKNIFQKDFETDEKENENIKYNNKKLTKSNSTGTVFYKDPTDYSKMNLIKNNFRISNGFANQRNWWKIDP